MAMSTGGRLTVAANCLRSGRSRCRKANESPTSSARRSMIGRWTSTRSSFDNAPHSHVLILGSPQGVGTQPARVNSSSELCYAAYVGYDR